MRAVLIILIAVLGCKDDRSAAPKEPATSPPPKAPPAGDHRPLAADVELRLARFVLRHPESMEASPMAAERFAVAIEDLGGVARTTIEVEIGNRTKGAKEAVVQLPLSPGAAVTGATLWAGDDQLDGVFVKRRPAGKTRDEIGEREREREREPMLVRWDRGTVVLEIYPVPAGGVRRFSLTWVEAIGDGAYRVPVLAQEEEVVRVANPVTVDGEPAEVVGGVVQLSEAPAIVKTVRAGEEPARYQLVSGPRAAGGLVIVTETGVDVSIEQLAWQRKTIEALLALIPETTVTVLAADWVALPIATASRAKDVSLDALASRKRAGLLDVEGAMERAVAQARGIGAGAIVWVGNADSDLAMKGRSVWLTRLAELGLQSLRLFDPARQGLRSVHGNRPGPFNRKGTTAAMVGKAAVRVDRDPNPRTRWVLIPSASGAPVWISRTDETGGETSGELGAAVEALWARAAFSRPLLYQQVLRLPTQVVGPEVSLIALKNQEDAPEHGLPAPSPETGESPGGGEKGGPPSRRPRRPMLPTPDIEMASPVVTGAEPDRIESRLRRNHGWLERCYRKRLEDEPISGPALVRFEIYKNGTTSFPRLEGIRDPEISECMHDWLSFKRFDKSASKRTVEVGIAFQSKGVGHWQQALERIDAGEPASRVEAAIAGLAEGKSGTELYWTLWQPMRKGGYFGARCRVLPWLFEEAGQLDTARRLLSECALDFRRLVRQSLIDWKQADDLPRVMRVRRSASRRGGRP